VKKAQPDLYIRCTTL